MRLLFENRRGWAPGARLPALATAAALLLVGAAAEGREVDYRAPAECPAAADVAAGIESRAPRGAPASLAIEKTKSGFHGELVAGEGDARLARSVDARSCGAVVEALALVLALASDAEPPEPAEPAEPAAVPPRSELHEGQPALLAAPSAVAADVPATAGAERAAPRILSFGTNVSYQSFSERHTLLVASLYADLALPSRIGGVPYLQPSFRVSLGGSPPFTTSSNQITVRAGTSNCLDCGPELAIAKAAFDACPVGANLDGTVSLALCGRAEVGVLFADLRGYDADAERRPWMAAGPVLRSRVMWGSGPYRPLFEVTAGMLAPLRRDRFHYDGYPTDVATSWIWTVGFGGGLAFR